MGRNNRSLIITLFILAISLVAVTVVLADYLGPNRTTTTVVWRRLRCSYLAEHDDPGPGGYYACTLNMYRTPSSGCPSTGSVAGYFSDSACGWPNSCSGSWPCSISGSSSTEGCSDGESGCEGSTQTVNQPPATISGSISCGTPGSNGWCRSAASLNSQWQRTTLRLRHHCPGRHSQRRDLWLRRLVVQCRSARRAERLHLLGALIMGGLLRDGLNQRQGGHPAPNDIRNTLRHIGRQRLVPLGRDRLRQRQRHHVRDWDHWISMWTEAVTNPTLKSPSEKGRTPSSCARWTTPGTRARSPSRSAWTRLPPGLP